MQMGQVVAVPLVSLQTNLALWFGPFSMMFLGRGAAFPPKGRQPWSPGPLFCLAGSQRAEVPVAGEALPTTAKGVRLRFRAAGSCLDESGAFV